MPTSPPEPNISSSPIAADPLSKLHKMSTTAGVASQQYVAVNTAAVLAALLGVASMMAMFSPLLLVIPAGTIGVAIFAWPQIANRHGTGTGKVLSIYRPVP